ncbi:MAG: serine hydrolase domain-containing protein [Muribaculaceae bacterium]
MKRLLSLIMGLAVVLNGTIAAELPKTPDETDYSSFHADINSMIDSLHVVGLSLAVVKDNKIVYTGAFGHKSLAPEQPLSVSTKFRIASISKSFVATAIMQLADRGKLNINDDVNRWLPFEVRNPAYPDVPITVAMLMSHTSSINDSQGYYISYDCINPAANPDYAKCYNSYAPGQKYEYCNLNFNLLGIVIERASSQRFDRYIVQNLLEPLGIDGNFCVNYINTDSCATLYAWEDSAFVARPQAYRPIDNLNDYQMEVSTVKMSPAGGMKISAPDLARYMLMHMNHGKSPLAEKRIISKKSSKLMQADHTPTDEYYGFALEKSEEFVQGVPLTGHTGGAYGLTSAMFFNPKEHYGFVVICNGSRNGHKVLVQAQQIMYNHFIKTKK